MPTAPLDWHALQSAIRSHLEGLPPPPRLSVLPADLPHRWHTACQADHATESDHHRTDWLIEVFSQLFHGVVLVRGGDEPLYLPATNTAPAQIIFAHGYLASALHELAHWCLAGQARRLLEDFGYWYSPTRDHTAQAHFETVEVAPQAIECLLSAACATPFGVSVDNLSLPHHNTRPFERAVYHEVEHRLATDRLPTDARTLAVCLYHLTSPPHAPLTSLP